MRVATYLLLLTSWLPGILAFEAAAQPPDTLWTRSYVGGTAFKCVSALPDNGFFVGGHCCPYMYMHYFWVSAYLARMDAAGNSVWPGGVQATGAEVTDVHPLPDGGCVAGVSMGLGVLCTEPTIVRLSADGAHEWAASPEPQGWFYNTDTLAAVCRLEDGGFAAAGWFGDSSLVFRTDSGGQILWTRSFYPTRIYSITTAPDTGIVVAGADSYYLARLNSSGDTLWTRHFMVGAYSECRKVITAPNGGYLMIGGSGEVGFFGSAAMVSAEGALVWQQFYGFSEGFVAAERCAEGGYILLSNLLVRIAANGDTLWTRALPCDSCVHTGVAQTADSGYIVSGYSSDRWFGQAYLAKFAREGLAADPRALMPSTFALSAYPNPFNPSTTLSFSLPRGGRVVMVVYDLMGRQVSTLTDELFTAGEHTLRFDGSSLPSGIYFARIESGEFTATQKLLLLK